MQTSNLVGKLMSSSAFVHIIESPAPSDLLDGRTEGRTLNSFLELADISSSYSLATNEDTFYESISDRLAHSVSAFRVPPILHFSGHGNEEGIGLTDGTLIEWRNLAPHLRPINEGLNGTFLVCLSSCRGATGGLMALNAKQPLPMQAVVASKGTVGWHESAIGYLTFYHHLLVLERTVDESVAAMNVASGRDDFVQIEGAKVQNLAKQFAAYSEQERNRILDSLTKRSITLNPTP